MNGLTTFVMHQLRVIHKEFFSWSVRIHLKYYVVVFLFLGNLFNWSIL